MGVSAQLFVVTKPENLLKVGEAVTEVMSAYSRKKLDDYWKVNTTAANRCHFMWGDEYKKDNVRFTNGAKVSSHEFRLFTIHFGSGEDYHRMLSMYPDTKDYAEVAEGYKISFSIGHWGLFEEIMGVVAETLKPFGDVYYDHNDSDDEDFVKL